MVQLHIKKGDESQFLFNTSVNSMVDDCYDSITMIYNGRLKINRICEGMKQLSLYGVAFPPNMVGLTEEQVQELNLVDEYSEKCVPDGGWTLNKDPLGLRNGRQPMLGLQQTILNAAEEASSRISKKQVQAGVFLNEKIIQDTISMLEGVVKLIYPMNLPPYDPIRLEFENSEDLSGTQESLNVIQPNAAQLWFTTKLLQRGDKLAAYVGQNEKTKVVLKITVAGGAPPTKEPIMTSEDAKLMILHAHRRQEELKGIEKIFRGGGNGRFSSHSIGELHIMI